MMQTKIHKCVDVDLLTYAQVSNMTFRIYSIFTEFNLIFLHLIVEVSVNLYGVVNKQKQSFIGM